MSNVESYNAENPGITTGISFLLLLDYIAFSNHLLNKCHCFFVIFINMLRNFVFIQKPKFFHFLYSSNGFKVGSNPNILIIHDIDPDASILSVLDTFVYVQTALHNYTILV